MFHGFSHIRSHFFFFNDTATTEIYTLSLHDALPISKKIVAAETAWMNDRPFGIYLFLCHFPRDSGDRKSTRLNSSHVKISYAVFCLKKKNNKHPFHLRHL